MSNLSDTRSRYQLPAVGKLLVVAAWMVHLAGLLLGVFLVRGGHLKPLQLLIAIEMVWASALLFGDGMIWAGWEHYVVESDNKLLAAVKIAVGMLIAVMGVTMLWPVLVRIRIENRGRFHLRPRSPNWYQWLMVLAGSAAWFVTLSGCLFLSLRGEFLPALVWFVLYCTACLGYLIFQGADWMVRDEDGRRHLLRQVLGYSLYVAALCGLTLPFRIYWDFTH